MVYLYQMEFITKSEVKWLLLALFILKECNLQQLIGLKLILRIFKIVDLYSNWSWRKPERSTPVFSGGVEDKETSNTKLLSNYHDKRTSEQQEQNSRKHTIFCFLYSANMCSTYSKDFDSKNKKKDNHSSRHWNDILNSFRWKNKNKKEKNKTNKQASKQTNRYQNLNIIFKYYFISLKLPIN